jgi:hypothetical protein
LYHQKIAALLRLLSVKLANSVPLANELPLNTKTMVQQAHLYSLKEKADE